MTWTGQTVGKPTLVFGYSIHEFWIPDAEHHGGGGVYNMTGVSQSVIFGAVSGDKQAIRLNLEIHCSSCKRIVPGGVRVSKRHYGDDEFDTELQAFMRRYSNN